MHAVFMAKGPLFKAGQIIKPFNSIDLYNLFCHIVKIKCHVNDGQWDAAFWSSSLKEPVTNEESATEPVSISFWTCKQEFKTFEFPILINNQLHLSNFALQ